ncbi:hypothetical protein ACRS6B_19360 [Nocardia asteroides]
MTPSVAVRGPEPLPGPITSIGTADSMAGSRARVRECGDVR